MQLAQQVYAYYTQNFDKLAQDKKFHFASRLLAWNGDTFAKTYLETVKSSYVKNTDEIKSDLQELMARPASATVGAAKLRKVYFEKYPSLHGIMLALFRVRHLLALYNVDAREALLALIDKTELYALSDALQNDTDALKTLSTYAINYIYLVEVILFPRGESSLSLSQLLNIGRSYDTDSKEHVQLFIYFYTHCIIGASNFYKQAIHEAHRPQYLEMIHEIEAIIDLHYDDIKLDNKLEFLVCSRIVGHTTPLAEKIYAECAQSVSADGTFLVDTFNAFSKNALATFYGSEHRNVLFIMSTTDYSPAI